MYTYARRVPRRAPGWAGRGFEVVAPLARANRKSLRPLSNGYETVGLQELAMDFVAETCAFGLEPRLLSEPGGELRATAKDTVPHMELSFFKKEEMLREQKLAPACFDGLI